MPQIERFEEIHSWQKGRELCRLVYSITRQSVFARDYGLRDQIRRAAVSIMSNIAEGFESQNNRTFVRHLYIARGSAAEVRAQVYVAPDQEYITKEEFGRLYELTKDIARLLTRFITYLEEHPDSKPSSSTSSPTGN
jgi:four helix bundle protein